MANSAENYRHVDIKLDFGKRIVANQIIWKNTLQQMQIKKKVHHIILGIPQVEWYTTITTHKNNIVHYSVHPLQLPPSGK